ncbi:MAG: hypothetical protein SOZ08_04885 [Erysipelotrichaceae bacterium]|nr:hypothetical protein [Erysipelotrichaceae bacterium]
MSDFELISIMLAMISLLITVAIAAYKAGRSNKNNRPTPNRLRLF